MQILNIPVSPSLLERWRGYLAPSQHHLYLTAAEAQALALPTVPRLEVKLTHELGNTYAAWGIAKEADQIALLSAADFDELPKRIQNKLLSLQVKHQRGNVPLGRHFRELLPELPAGRFLWQPKHLTPEVLSRIISKGQAPC